MTFYRFLLPPSAPKWKTDKIGWKHWLRAQSQHLDLLFVFTQKHLPASSHNVGKKNTQKKTNNNKRTLFCISLKRQERAGKPQTQLLKEYQLAFCQSSRGGLLCAQVWMSPSRNPTRPLVLIHIPGRCHSVFVSTSPGVIFAFSTFFFLFLFFSFLRIIWKVLSLHDKLKPCWIHRRQCGGLGALLKHTLPASDLRHTISFERNYYFMNHAQSIPWKSACTDNLQDFLLT